MSDKYKTIILPEAQCDIRSIVLYVAGDFSAPQAAINLQDAFEEGISSLAEMPERIKAIDAQPWGNAGVRKIRIRNYYIYFAVSKEELEVKIMAAIYIGRDQEKLMSEHIYID